jgi:hypothetical protein
MAHTCNPCYARGIGDRDCGLEIGPRQKMKDLIKKITEEKKCWDHDLSSRASAYQGQVLSSKPPNPQKMNFKFH